MPGIIAALDRHDANGFLHGCIDHANHSRGKVFERESGILFRQPLPCDTACALQVELKVSSQETMRLQAAEQEIGIGDGGQRSAAIADGAGLGTGRLGSDAQCTGGIEAGERASSGAHGVNVEHGDAHGQARDLGLGACFGLVVDEGDVGRGATHVEGNQLLAIAEPGGGLGSDDASGRTREHGAHGLTDSGGQGGDPAARLHHEDVGLGICCRLAQALLQASQVTLHHRL